MMTKLIWALKVAPQDDADGLHELGLSWYRFQNEIGDFDKSLQPSARPAVWIKFSQIDQLDRLQRAYPEVKLGPADSFNEALLFSDRWEEGEALKKNVLLLFERGEESDEMEGILREDTLEDY
jgi:hypothetical protein